MDSGMSEASPPAAPGGWLVVQSLGQRLAAHLPAGAVLVERVLQADPAQASHWPAGSVARSGDVVGR